MKKLNQKQFLKKAAVYLLTLLLASIYLYVGNSLATENLGVFTDEELKVIKVRVEVVLEAKTETEQIDEKTTLVLKDIPFSGVILEGENKGKTLNACQSLGGLGAADVKPVKVGDKVLVSPVESSDTGYPYEFTEYLRSDSLFVLAIVFAALLVLFGRMKGVNTLLSLGLTCGAIFFVFVPAVLSGYNIYFLAIVTCLYAILVSFSLIYGFDRKSIAAALGCVCGVTVAGLLTLVLNEILHLTGMVDEDAFFLSELNTASPIDLKAIVFAAILIGALGAMMDISMSMASSLWEIRQTAASPNFKMLMKSGVAIGRDLMGINVNTLILAYIGSSLTVVLLMIAYNHSLTELLNREMIVVEILQTLTGSLGILLTIPLTSLFASTFYMGKSSPDTEK